MNKDDIIIEKIYAGWLGKLIGVRMGAPIEMWTAERIAEKYGELDGYPVDYVNFGADDDTNGNIFALNAFYDFDKPPTEKEFGQNLLNYAPFEHGYFWFGGYGVSEEHTAYLNLVNGIAPPLSGSASLNGRTLSEQIGGQIFSDIYGLICPADPASAADFAQKAARVTHDGEAVYGAGFVAGAIASAFCAKDVDGVIDGGLSQIPPESLYAQTVAAVRRFHSAEPSDYKLCLQYVKQNFWTDKFGGSCHIIPNAAIMILSLCYGGGDFDKSMNICCRCGFDTDCNASNIGVMLGVLNGLKGIDYKKWRAPINDITVCSSVLGCLNICDACGFALRLARTAQRLRGKKFDASYGLTDGGDTDGVVFSFGLPGSTCGFYGDGAAVMNAERRNNAGVGALKISGGGRAARRTYYAAQDLWDNRYDPWFSPLVYPGQTLSCFVDGDGAAALYARLSDGKTVRSGTVALDGKSGRRKLALDIPPDHTGAKITEIGLESDGGEIYAEDFRVRGEPSYTLDFSRPDALESVPTFSKIGQCSYLKGYWRVEDGALVGSCADFGELYSGAFFKDARVECRLTPLSGEHHKILFCVRGALRSFAVGFDGAGKLVLTQKDGSLNPQTLAERDFNFTPGKSYLFAIEVKNKSVLVSVDGLPLIAYDAPRPLPSGAFGVRLERGSSARIDYFSVNKKPF